MGKKHTWRQAPLLVCSAILLMASVAQGVANPPCSPALKLPLKLCVHIALLVCPQQCNLPLQQVSNLQGGPGGTSWTGSFLGPGPTGHSWTQRWCTQPWDPCPGTLGTQRGHDWQPRYPHATAHHSAQQNLGAADVMPGRLEPLPHHYAQGCLAPALSVGSSPPMPLQSAPVCMASENAWIALFITCMGET